MSGQFVKPILLKSERIYSSLRNISREYEIPLRSEVLFFASLIVSCALCFVTTVMAVESTLLAPAIKGQTYTGTIDYSIKGVSFEKIRGELPVGLSFDEKTGQITGTPSNSSDEGTYSFAVSVTDAAKNVTYIGFKLQLKPAPQSRPVVAAGTGTGCPSSDIVDTYDKPMLDFVEATSTSVSGNLTNLKLSSGEEAKVQICVYPSNSPGTVQQVGTATVMPGRATGSASFNIPVANDKKLNQGDKLVAQLLITDKSGQTAFGPPTEKLLVGSCSKRSPSKFTRLQLSYSLDSSGKPKYSLTGAATQTVRVCVNDLERNPPLEVNADGTFNSSLSTLKIEPGSSVSVQETTLKSKGNNTNGSSDNTTYGNISNSIVTGNCIDPSNQQYEGLRPTLDLTVIGSSFVTGKAPELASPGSGKATASPDTKIVRICVGNTQVATANVRDDGTFVAPLPAPLSAGSSVIAQMIYKGSDGKVTYGIPAYGKTKFAYSQFAASFIGGVEQSGFSSQSSSTTAFLSAFFRSHYLLNKDVSPSLWGRVRLLGGPLPSSANIASAITNPTGTITTSTFSSVGQVVDFVVGPELRLYQKDHYDGTTDRISLIGGVGATTPLPSNQLQQNFQVPASNSQQCFQLVQQYPKYFNAGTGSGSSCTLTSALSGAAVSSISFASEDRSNFFRKYAGGFRFAHVYPAKGQQPAYTGTLDLVVGQDESITGGYLQGAVIRADGYYPLLIGGSSFVYLFGSASIKPGKVSEGTPIILDPATAAPSQPLPAGAVVLPLMQPNRDFYRIGVGLNLTSIICKLKADGCNSGGSAAPNQAGNKQTAQQSNQTAVQAMD
jgi:hypothetical protein